MMRSKCINIYNIFPRAVENNKALFSSIERARYMGFDTIYFNPFFKTGKSGSIYSIADYYSFDRSAFDEDKEPEQQVKDITAICNKNRLRPIIDLVINHTSIDSELVKNKPEFYCYENGKIKLASGRDTEQRIIWYDSAQLDYYNIQSGLWEYILDVCKYYISLGFRGFRCDAADQVNLAFWIWLIREVKKAEPDILFIGEAYLCPMNTRIGLAYAGFDYIYNSAKWWDYKSDWLLNEYNSTCKYIDSISFPDNHDTRRLMDETAGNVRHFLKHLYFTAFWSQGFEITMGTEFGACKQLDCVKTRRCHQEAQQYDFTEHIKEAIEIRSLVFSKYDDNEPQNCIFNKASVQILKKSCGFIVDLDNVEVHVWENIPNHSKKYIFNCRDAKPEFYIIN